MSPAEQQLFAAPGSLIPLSQAAKLTPYSSEYLRLLVRKGSVKAIKIRRDWLTTEAAVLEYVEQQKQRHHLYIEELSKPETLEKQNAQAGFAAVKLLLVLGLAIMATSGFLVLITTGILPNKTLAQISAPTGLLSLGQALLGKTPEEYLAEDLAASPTPIFALAKHRIEPRGPEAPPQSAAPTSVLADESASQQPQVLGESVTAGDLATLVANAVQAKLNELIASGILKGPKGDKGDSPAVIVPANPGLAYSTESFYQPNQSQNFTGGSVQGVTQLSSNSFSTNDASIGNNLTVGGSASVQSLNVAGSSTFSGSTTIVGLTVTTLNPGLTQGSIAFQGAIGLTQDNANFFYDATNHRLGIGTTGPESKLDVVGTTTSSVIIAGVNDGYATNQTLRSSAGARLDSNGTGTETVVFGNAGTQILKIHDTRTDIGSVAVYVKHDGGGGAISFQRTLLPSSTICDIGVVGGVGTLTGSATNQDDFGVMSYSTCAGGSGTGAIRFYPGTAERWVMYPNGNLTGVGVMQADVGVQTANSGFLGWAGRSIMRSPSNGLVAFKNWAEDADSSISAGGATFSGNVGIGTTSPNATLQVYGTGGTNPFLVSSSTGTGLMVIQQNGNIGIGTTSPAATLEISNTGAAQILLTATGGGNGRLQFNPSGGFGDIRFLTADGSDTKVLRMSGGGDVTTNRGAVFESYGNEASSAGAAIIRAGDGGNIQLLNGNIGIGTTSPAANLHVYGSGATPVIAIDGDSAAQSYLDFRQANVSKAYIQYNSAGYLDFNQNGHMVLKSGNVGIGSTSPTALTTIQGTSGSTTDLLNVASSTNTSLFVVKSNGNVGIGTSSPPHLITLSGGAFSDGATWSNASDRNIKENFATVTPADILQKIDTLDIQQWNYKTDSASTTHIGPTAQDFYTAFHTGGDFGQTSISTIDPSGVALLGIQALDQKITALQGALNGNATNSNLTVYNPSNFSGDSVGEAKILTGQTSVRITFTQPYQYQPIITFSPVGPAAGAAIAAGTYLINIDASGFNIQLPVPVTSDATFTWHSFASPAERLTVSDGTTSPILLILPAALPPPTPPSALTVISDPSTPTTSPDTASTTPPSAINSGTQATSTPTSVTSQTSSPGPADSSATPSETSSPTTDPQPATPSPSPAPSTSIGQ